MTSTPNQIELARIMELELAELAIVGLTDLVKEQQAAAAAAAAPAGATQGLRVAAAVRKRVRWGQSCVDRLTARETLMGALEAGREAATKALQSVIRFFPF